jgi:hypothetical protein
VILHQAKIISFSAAAQLRTGFLYWPIQDDSDGLCFGPSRQHQTSQKRNLLSSTVPLRTEFLYWSGFRVTAMYLTSGWLCKDKQAKIVSFSVRPHRYEQDFYIGQFRITAMGLVFDCLGNCKPGKPKVHLSQYGRTAMYRISILACLR